MVLRFILQFMVVSSASITLKVTRVVNWKQLWIKNLIMGVYDEMRANFLKRRAQNKKMHYKRPKSGL